MEDPEVLFSRTGSPQVCCVHSVTDVSGVFCKREESDFVVKIVVHFIYKKENCDV
jgi:hypothetical protein